MKSVWTPSQIHLGDIGFLSRRYFSPRIYLKFSTFTMSSFTSLMKASWSYPFSPRERSRGHACWWSTYHRVLPVFSDRICFGNAIAGSCCWDPKIATRIKANRDFKVKSSLLELNSLSETSPSLAKTLKTWQARSQCTWSPWERLSLILSHVSNACDYL